jgi:hypothetical protein
MLSCHSSDNWTPHLRPYDVLAKMMSAINSEFGLNDKIRYTVTDNGANFIKAFKHFSVDSDHASASGQDTGSDDAASFD